MDAVDFHDQATTPAAKPPAFTAAELAEATDDRLAKYVDAVTSWVGQVYVPAPATVTLAAAIDSTTRMNDVGLSVPA